MGKRLPSPAALCATPRLLIVKDNEMNRDILSRRLIKRGFEVREATDGEQGVELAVAYLPDLILMDMSLPRMDGWEATRRVKACPETAHIPVIALTAHAMANDREKALAAGCDDYATKPLELPRLLEQISVLLPGRVRGGFSRGDFRAGDFRAEEG